MGRVEENNRDKLKMDPFYRVENRGPEQSLVLGYKENQDRGKAKTLDPDSSSVFSHIPKALKPSSFVSRAKETSQRLKAEVTNSAPEPHLTSQHILFGKQWLGP